MDIFEPQQIREAADKVEDLKLDMLVVGDAKKYCIERKQVFDLMSSIREGRIWNQLERLKKLQESDGYLPRLIIEGDKQKLFNFEKVKVRRGLKGVAFGRSQYIGLLNSIIDFGVPIIYTDNVEDTILTLKNLNKRAGDLSAFVRPTIQKGSGRKVHEEQEDVLSAISGIGNITASKLLKKYGTIQNVWEVEIHELELIAGINTAKHIKEILSIVYVQE